MYGFWNLLYQFDTLDLILPKQIFIDFWFIIAKGKEDNLSEINWPFLGKNSSSDL